MANMFVAKDGNDSNNGSTWALAKLTIQAAVTAAATGDVIQVGSGVYNEAVTQNPATGKTLTLQGNGYVIIDGGGSLANGIHVSGASAAQTMTINDIIIKSFTNSGIRTQSTNLGSHAIINRCRIYDCLNGALNDVNNVVGTVNMADCVIHHCTNGINMDGTGGNVNNVDRCTVVDCTTGIRHASNMTLNVRRCIFAKNSRHIRYDSITNIGAGDAHNYNLLWFDGVSDALWNATTVTTLANWQSNSSRDTNSLSEDPVFMDRLQRMYLLAASSPALGKLLTFGAGSAGPMPSSTVMGVVGMSKNDPNGFWAGRILTNTEVNASDRIQLTSGQTSGTARTPVMDLGSPRRIRRLNIWTNLATAMYPTDVPDFGTGDVQPKKMTIRWRGSLTSFANADASPSWNEVEPSAFGPDLDSVYRYVQVEVTLRNNGA